MTYSDALGVLDLQIREIQPQAFQSWKWHLHLWDVRLFIKKCIPLLFWAPIQKHEHFAHCPPALGIHMQSKARNIRSLSKESSHGQKSDLLHTE